MNHNTYVCTLLTRSTILDIILFIAHSFATSSMWHKTPIEWEKWKNASMSQECLSLFSHVSLVLNINPSNTYHSTGDPPVTRILGLLQIRVIGKSCYRRSFKYYFTIKQDFWTFKVHFLSFLLLIITPKTHAELIEWSNMSTKCQSNPQRPRNIFRLFFRF